MHTYETKSKKERNLLLAVALLLLLLIGGAIFAGVYFLQGDAAADEPPAPSGIIYDDNAQTGGWESLSPEEITNSLNEKVEEGYINISMNTSPVFADGKAQGNLMIVNEAVNRYPQRVVITLADTGEIIYASGAIPVGSKIEADTLDVVLHAGTYPCIAMFHSLDPDTGAILGSAGANINITILN